MGHQVMLVCGKSKDSEIIKRMVEEEAFEMMGDIQLVGYSGWMELKKKFRRIRTIGETSCYKGDFKKGNVVHVFEGDRMNVRMVCGRIAQRLSEEGKDIQIAYLEDIDYKKYLPEYHHHIHLTGSRQFEN